MNNNRTNLLYVNSVIWLTILILTTNFFNFLSYGASSIAEYLIVALAALCLLLLRPGRLDPLFFRILLPLLLLILVYAVSTGIDYSFQALKHTGSLFVCVSIFIFTFQNARIIASSRQFFLVSVALVSLCFFVALLSLVSTKNGMSGISAYYIAILALLLLVRNQTVSNTVMYSYIGVAVISLIVDHRALMGISFITFMYFLIFKGSLKSKLIHRLVPFALATAIFIFILTMIDAGPLPISDINHYFVEFTGRPATSGREVIWILIINALRGNEMFGLGAGALYFDLVDDSLSAHSMYMQIMMQTGFIGLSLFALSLFFCWNLLLPKSNNEWSSIRIYAATLIIFITIHSSTEVFLTQNLLFIGIPAWIAAGLALGLCSEYRTNAKRRLVR